MSMTWRQHLPGLTSTASCSVSAFICWGFIPPIDCPGATTDPLTAAATMPMPVELGDAITARAFACVRVLSRAPRALHSEEGTTLKVKVGLSVESPPRRNRPVGS